MAPEEASDEQERAVRFFHKQLLVTLDATLTSDAMIGRSIMETLDLKTLKMKNDEDAANLKSGGKTGGWDKAPNVWASTMATAALFLDKASGASDTESIVHNLTRPEGDKKRKTKQFKKKQGNARAELYSKYFFHFQDIWVENRKSTKGITKMVSNLAAWDLYTGMTRKSTMSDAQKRARKLASATDENMPEKKQKMCCLGETVNYNRFINLVTGISGDSDSDSDSEKMMLEQNEEVEGNHVAL